ncbi:cystatin-F [Bombina bombina]|uniref:cystatin-F n=1 Tax=Bombina bombina TaxID=8345 RepID=UPI00235AB8E5|nr:cystatin-F [Bombina bombina]
MRLIWGLLLLVILHTQDFPGKSSALDYQNTTIHPGFPKNASTNDPEVKKATRFAVYAYNNKSNDSFLFKEMEIQKAMIQLVKGIKYMIKTEIGRTVCKKKEQNNLDKCEFQEDKPLKQEFTCYFEVWVIPWQHIVNVPVLQCY